MPKLAPSLRKLEQTKEAIILLLNSCGPADIAEILSEVRVQAYPGRLPQSLRELLRDRIIYLAEDGSYQTTGE